MHTALALHTLPYTLGSSRAPLPHPNYLVARVSFLPSIRPSFPLVRTSRPLALAAPFTLLFSCPKPCLEAPLVTQLNNWCAPPTSLSVGDFRDWTQTHTQPLTCTPTPTKAHTLIHSPAPPAPGVLQDARATHSAAPLPLAPCTSTGAAPRRSRSDPRTQRRTLAHSSTRRTKGKRLPF